MPLQFEKLLDRVDLPVPQRRHRLMVGRGKHKGEIASAQYSGPEDLAPYFDPLCRERNDVLFDDIKHSIEQLFCGHNRTSSRVFLLVF